MPRKLRASIKPSPTRKSALKATKPSKLDEDTTTEESDQRDETYQPDESDEPEYAAERGESGELKEPIRIHGCVRHPSGFGLAVSFGKDPRIYIVLPPAFPPKY
jgi:hypothetical protein